MTAAARAHLEFAVRLHDRLAPGTDDSVCWSPYSVAATLTLAELGAGGQTLREVRGLLAGSAGVPIDARTAFLRAGAEFVDAVNVEPPEFAVHNTMFVLEELPIHEGFHAALAGMGGVARPAPFDVPERARALINAAVAESTRDLIAELVPPDVLSRDTVATLVNALYLKTAWVSPFPRAESVEQPFHAPSGSRPVPMMRTTQAFGYVAAAGWQAVSLAAAGGVRADILLPDDPAVLDSPLAAGVLAELLAAPRGPRVDLTMPKLDLRTAARLFEVLAAAGAPTMFSDDADFSALSPERIAVSDVLHESVLRLDEDGLLGAAATAMVVRKISARPPEQPVVVRVDRPFLLLVRHADTGAVYFLATVREPG